MCSDGKCPDWRGVTAQWQWKLCAEVSRRLRIIWPLNHVAVQHLNQQQPSAALLTRYNNDHRISRVPQHLTSTSLFLKAWMKLKPALQKKNNTKKQTPVTPAQVTPPEARQDCSVWKVKTSSWGKQQQQTPQDTLQQYIAFLLGHYGKSLCLPMSQRQSLWPVKSIDPASRNLYIIAKRIWSFHQKRCRESGKERNTHWERTRHGLSREKCMCFTLMLM